MNAARTVATLALVFAAGALAACQGAPEDAAKDKPAAAAPAAKSWDDMSREEHEHVMKSVVVPTMKPLFAAFDADEFGKMNCATCHGKDAKARDFEMPNPALPKLPTDAAGWKELEETEPAAVKFMRETVVPKMAAIIGEPPYDPATQKGFGCFECHTKK